jgi:hypothetical protein
MRTFVFLLVAVFGTTNISVAQNDRDSTQSGMPEHAGHMSMNAGSHSLIDLIEQHATAGTDIEPISTPQNMLMTTQGEWMFMLHGVAFLNDTQQTGPRGADKPLSTNWIMLMAQRELGRGTLTLRTMLSLEPATVSDRRYPLLFQQGETAFGRPIVDGQHPHDFFMELAAMYDAKLSDNTLLSFYFAPMGSPALGPMAYPHRASASENPVATLGHHLQDSTHIADDVITVGLLRRGLRVEASGFHGREPDEFRWNLDSGAIDSWATRLTVNPARNWSAQYSIGQLHSPETLSPNEDLSRMTASVMYNRLFHIGNLASMLLWGRNQSLGDGNVGNSFLAESTLRSARNGIWTRIESTDRTNELLLDGNPIPPGFEERYFTRVQAYTAGYDREVGHIPHLSTAIGGQLTFYGVPDVLKSAYGSHPLAVNVFLRARIK